MKILLCAALLLLLTGCSGLPQPREMRDMALLRTMGVDTAEEGVAVTAATGPRAKGVQGERQPALVLTARSGSLSGASLSIQRRGEDYAFFGYVDQLLAGEELARQGLGPVLDYFVQDRELGLGTLLWIVREDTAERAVRSGGDNGVEERLSTLRTDGKLGVAPPSRTVGEVYTDLLELGSAYLPALVLDEDGETLTAGSYAVLKGDVLVGCLDGEQARGLELLNGKPGQDILELEVENGRVAVWISGASVERNLLFEGDVPSALELVCRVEARAVEGEDTLSSDGLEQLRDRVTRRQTQRIQSALSQLQRWGADCVALGARAGIKCPERWRQLREHWPERFAGLEVRVRVEVELPDPT